MPTNSSESAKPFLARISAILNSGQSRSLLLTGNVYDLFYDDEKYVPLMNYLSKKLATDATAKKRGLLPIVYEVNKPIQMMSPFNLAPATEVLKTLAPEESIDLSPKGELKRVWGREGEYSFEKMCQKAVGNPALALEFLRQLCLEVGKKGKNFDIVVIIEGMDMILPDGEFSRMSADDRHRIAIVHDWVSDPEFMGGRNSVLFISESRSLIHERVRKLPQVLAVNIPSPTYEVRSEYLKKTGYNRTEIPLETLARDTAGLTLHALRQLTCEKELNAACVVAKIEEFLMGELGEDTVEFFRPSHTFEETVGFTKVKKYIVERIIPRIVTDDKKVALSGAVFAGPIGGGKTFLGEGLASRLDCPVLVIKNVRSQWYGQTDVCFERLERVLETLDKVTIFVDEADTQFASLTDGNTHETERRLVGKFQALMSNPRFLGRAFWLLMTARIERLSADIRRPGRAGDEIIPILDPEGEDRDAFIKWSLGDLWEGIKAILDNTDNLNRTKFLELTKDYSAASFGKLKKEIAAEKKFGKCESFDQVISLLEDVISADIQSVRRYQILQAKLNCTRRSLLFNDDPHTDIEKIREGWRKELNELEAQGVG